MKNLPSGDLHKAASVISRLWCKTASFAYSTQYLLCCVNYKHAAQTLTKSFLAWVLGKIEGELVEVLELPRISDIFLQRLTPFLQLLHRITAEKTYHFDYLIWEIFTLLTI